jgi:CO/xanthine dehydrogenase Mo-binding subunit
MSTTRDRGPLAAEQPINADPATFRWLGRPMPVIEDRRFVRGRGRYINDLDLPGMLHIGVVSATVAHARLIDVDVSAARRAPGVVTVLTGADVAARMEPLPQELPLPNVVWYPLAVDKIRLAGEWVAAIVATSRAEAEDAAELVHVEYEELPPVVDPHAALLPGSPVLHEAHGSNVVWQETFDWGDVDAAFGRADRTFEFEYRWNRHSGVPLETFGCVAATAPSGLLEIWASHQNPGIQQELMRVLRLPTAKVHMDVDVGGSYGSKRGRKQMYLTALAALETDRPVKFIEDRVENMHTGDGHGPDRAYRIRLATSNDGIVEAIDIELVEDLGAYCGRGPRQITKPTAAVVGPYRIGAVRYGGYGVLTCKSNQVPFRGAGQSPHNFCLERSMDLIARELGIDRVEMRRRNYIQPDQFPYETPSGAVYDSGDYPGAMELAVSAADLPSLLAMQAAARRDGRLVGIGIAGAIEPSGGGGGDPEGARVEIDARGHVVVTIGFQSCGQSHESMVTQIACEELGVEPAQVRVERGHGLSGIVGGGPIGSRMTLMLGSAMKMSSGKVVDKMRQIAAYALEADAADVEFDAGRFQVAGTPARSLDVPAIAKMAYGARNQRPAGMEPGLVADSVYAGPNPVTRVLAAKSFPSYAFDFHIPVVEVDPDTLQIRFLRYVVVHDCGTVLNPLVVDGFVYGGIGHGVGGAMFEQFRYDAEGQLLSSTFIDYLMPTAAEMPRVELHAMSTPSPLHPYGAKGAAEGAYLTAPAAIVSAIEDALAPLGVTIRQVPVTPQHLFDLTHRAVAAP